MKRHIYIFLSLVVVALGTSCKKNDDNGVPPAPVQNIQVFPDYGAVKFVWDQLDSASVLYARVDYVNAAGQPVVEKFSIHADTAYISGLDAQEYEFRITLFNHSEVASSAVSVSVVPLAPPYQLVASTIAAEALFGGAKFTWGNSSGKSVAVKISYTKNGTEEFVIVSSSAVEESTVILGLPAEHVDFIVTAQDETGNTSAERSISLTPYEEVRIDKTDWSITASTEESVGEGPNNGWAKHAIDDDIGTFWHSVWLGANPGYPHWISVDMHESIVVSRIELMNRQNNFSGFTSFEVEGSVDGEEWVSYGTFDFQQQNAVQSFSLAETPTVRHLRITMLEGISPYAFIAEFSVFGQRLN